MNNDYNFIKNYRNMLSQQAPRVLTPEERANPSFQGTKGQLPENYGIQQNAIGTTALSLLLTGLGLAPEAIATAIVGERLNRPKFQTQGPQIRARQVDEGYGASVIDKIPNESSLFENIKPIPQNSSYEDTLKILEENDKAIQKIRERIKGSSRTRGRR